MTPALFAAVRVGTVVAQTKVMELTDQIARHGAGLVFANVLAQQLGVPIPVEPTLVIAGALAATGMVSPCRVVGAAVFATLIADTVWLLVGRRYEQKLKKLLKFDTISKNGSDDSSPRFARWGIRSLILARFMPGAVQFIIPMAGARHVKLASLFLYDLTGIFLWTSLPVSAGMLFHRQLGGLLHAYSRAAVWFALAAMAAAAGALIWRRRRSKERTA
jgi:membrane protein DedA with SNARE-associated domain